MTPSRAAIMKSFKRVSEISQCLKRPMFCGEFHTPGWLMGSHAWVETTGRMAHVTILSDSSRWLPAEEEKISSFMANTRATLNFQEILNSLLILHMSSWWKVTQVKAILEFGTYPFTSLVLLSWVGLARRFPGAWAMEDGSGKNIFLVLCLVSEQSEKPERTWLRSFLRTSPFHWPQ